MSSRLIALTEAVKDKLNDATWSQEFTATRTAVPKYEAKSGTLEVAVRPFGTTYVGRSGRAKVERDYQIDIVIAKRVQISDNDSTDGLIDLAEEIAGWFEADDAGKWRVIQESPLPKAWCVGVESIAAAYAWEFAIEDQFVAVRRLTVKCVE